MARGRKARTALAVAAVFGAVASAIAPNASAAATAAPGCAWEVHRGDHFRLEGGYGVRRMGKPEPITVDTAFDIASMSKQFTALSILLLASQGMLDLDDPVRSRLPELPGYFEQISIRHLIWHTGGTPDYIRPLFKAGRDKALVTSEEVLEIIKATEQPNFVAGTRHAYSNSGYFLLAQIVERVSGKSMAAYAHDNIFGPLGMRNTRYVDHYPNPVSLRASGHRTRPDGAIEVVEITWEPTGDGQVFTTVKDLRRWMRVLAEGHATLAPDVLATFKQPGQLDNGQTQAYGYGLQHVKVGDHKVLMHDGGWSGSSSRFVWSPEGGGGILLCNYDDADVAAILDPIFLAYGVSAPAPQDGQSAVLKLAAGHTVGGLVPPGERYVFELKVPAGQVVQALFNGHHVGLALQTSAGAPLRTLSAPGAEPQSAVWITSTDAQRLIVHNAGGASGSFDLTLK